MCFDIFVMKYKEKEFITVCSVVSFKAVDLFPQ
jgi:hypothetical protein